MRCSPAPRRRRVLLALTFAALGVLLALLPGNSSTRNASIALARLRGYDGCTCVDCGDFYGFQGYDPTWICVTGRSRGLSGTQSLAMASGLTGTAILLTTLLPGYSRFPPGRCRHCGYDLSGCVLQVCPECGHARENPSG